MSGEQQSALFPVWAAECFGAGQNGRPFGRYGRMLGRTAEHVFQHFELQVNGSVLPSILLACL